MRTRAEELEHQIYVVNERSRELKANHKHGDWANWRRFIDFDILAKEISIELLQLEIDQLKDSMETYANY